MMRKIYGIAAALTLVFASAGAATATDIKLKGYFDFVYGWYSNTSTFGGVDSNGQSISDDSNPYAAQRLRFQIDFVASEQLSGTVQFEIGDIHWGSGGGDTWGWGESGRSTGGAMGSDGVNVETKHAYIDWIVPETDLSVRMGILPFALPNYANGPLSGGAVMDDDMAGIIAAYTFNDYIGLTLSWVRPWNPLTDDDWDRAAFTDHDAVDVFALTLPLTFAEYGLEITPWGMYGFVGETDDSYDSDTDTYSRYGDIGGGLSGTGGLGDDGRVWWAGLSFKITTWDPFFIYTDFMYGSYTSDDLDMWDNGAYLGNFDNDRDGWAVSARIGYKLEWATPSVIGWYGSGMKDDDSWDGLMPVLSPDWGFTSFGWSNSWGIFREAVVSGNNITGTWGIGLALEDLTFVEKLSHNIRVVYFQGTNDSSYGRTAPFVERTNPALFGGYLYTTDDWGMEVNLDTAYEIMEGLTVYNQSGYIHTDIDDAGGWNNDTDDAWEFAVGFNYTF